ncbi:MAG: VUT family protein, partial [Pseudomonadota bacterium]
VISQWLIKVAWEAFLTPVTYLVVGKLKQAEGVDLYDTETNFSPFATEKQV